MLFRSCLPKDVRAMLYRAKELDLELPVLEAILPSNELHIERAIDLVLSTGKRRVAVLGLSFKADTDDLRESPMLELVKRLLGEGCQVRIYDPQVELSTIVGANKQFVEEQIPHIGALIVSSLGAALQDSDVVVVSREAREFKELRDLLRPDHTVIQLARSGDLEGTPARRIVLC